MDIQVASNFERFLYYELGGDAAQVRQVMHTLQTTGVHRFANFDHSTFSTSRATDADITSNLRRVYETYGFIVDPHTACAFQDLHPDRLSIVLATAHPAKFPAAIAAAIEQEPLHATLEALKSRASRFSATRATSHVAGHPRKALRRRAKRRFSCMIRAVRRRPMHLSKEERFCSRNSISTRGLPYV
jgi:threonine synthase